MFIDGRVIGTDSWVGLDSLITGWEVFRKARLSLLGERRPTSD